MAHRMRHRGKEKELSPWISNTTRHPTRSQPNWKEFGLRCLATLMLNSFWGKFGQRPNQTQVSSCTKPTEFFQIITDDRQVIHRIEIVNENMVEVFHNFQEKTIPVQTNVNIFIACFTTSYARLKLYDALDTLQERVLYFDTDSVIQFRNLLKQPFPPGIFSDSLPMNSTRETILWSSWQQDLKTMLITQNKESKHAKWEDSHSTHAGKESYILIAWKS